MPMHPMKVEPRRAPILLRGMIADCSTSWFWLYCSDVCPLVAVSNTCPDRRWLRVTLNTSSLLSHWHCLQHGGSESMHNNNLVLFFLLQEANKSGDVSTNSRGQ